METVPHMKLWTAISVVIGCVIGSGIFVKPGRVLQATGDSNLAILAWVLGGLISLAGGLTMAEVASRIPKTGGVYVYVEELFGKSWGFVSGWVQAIIYGPALSSALSLYFASLLVEFSGLPGNLIKPIALIALFILSGLCAMSTKYGVWIQNITTVIKLIPIVVLGVLGLFMGDSPIFNSTLTVQTGATGMGVAILATLWAYDGWVQVANMGGEMENPSRNLPKAFLYGIVAVMAAYLLVNISLFHILPAQSIATLGEKSASAASETLLGGWAGKALALGIIISILGAINGNILTMPRVSYAMACRRSFPMADFFSLLHIKNQTPVNAIALKSTIAGVMILFLNPDRITDIAMFIMYLCYSGVFLGVFLLRKKYGKPTQGSYQVPLYPLMPLMACLGSLYVCYSMAAGAPWDALISVLIALSGIPVYFLLQKGLKTAEPVPHL